MDVQQMCRQNMATCEARPELFQPGAVAVDMPDA